MDQTRIETAIARVNGVALHASDETISVDVLRQRACTELLRQAAQAAGLLVATDSARADGIVSEAASVAIEALLERELRVPDPSEEDCRQHYAAQSAHLRTGERVHARHILFAVTPGSNVTALRKRAEVALLDVRCHDGKTDGVFASAARDLSNCPSAAAGGDLGWIGAADCAPEFARELFGHSEIGVLPRLVHSRFGLHVVEVLEREPGITPPFETVRGTIANILRQQAFVTATRQYLQWLAANASLDGVDLDAAGTPLIQ